MTITANITESLYNILLNLYIIKFIYLYI